MSVHEIEQAIAGMHSRLRDTTAALRHCRERYLVDGLSGYAAGVAEDLASLTDRHPWAFGAYTDPAWDTFQPDSAAPTPDGLRVGKLSSVGASALPPIPAVVRLVGHGHVFILAEPDGTPHARSVLQALTLRLATATAPGSARFALVDPVGAGQHLSAFLRLPPALRFGSGVAASPAEIENLLQRLIDHVVEVTQQRLTNVYASVADYNEATTGVPVPFTFLVLADLPAGLSDRGGELLLRLVRSGPRAGVYILASIDATHDVPRGFDLADLLSLGTRLDVHGGPRLTVNDPDLLAWPVDPDVMPPAARANPWLDAVGSVAGNTTQDLPFDQIAVAPENRWTGDSTDGLDVQIGVNAKGEPQHFVMGAQGVHHGLVGGDVGMGKTNLLHVLITQLALRYPPEELQLYLLDFKEVEFDAYLTERLPHARAVASRTDREFGLSMLRRFHDEIDRRARLCREAKVTHLPDYRRETGQLLPRALVVMDEFQVLFAEEDRLARQAAALVADIAKRGATFGLHLLLATQSPGGSLIAHLRPVYEQMALRIALRCTVPSVSQAILGEGNESATKLTRAGDAIYNDRRGEGANPIIRIAALPTREKLDRIAAIRALGGEFAYPPPASFDPDAPADFATHPACAAFAADPGTWPSPGPTVDAWLGEAIEIKPPTAATFERSMRSNLLIVGDEEHGHGLLLTTLLSAAVQRSPEDVSFVVAEFTKISSRFHRFFTATDRLPHKVRIAGPRAASTALDELVADLDERLADPDDTPRPERFFLVAGLHRWHELLGEVDYKPSETATALVRLADQGPEVGIHVVAWADGYAGAERALRRGGIGHFALRAVFRVTSPSESDSLLGGPAAAALDDDRGLYRDTYWPTEQVEKFKPYSIESLTMFAQSAYGRTS